jgi:excisionase family DNA binding protein
MDGGDGMITASDQDALAKRIAALVIEALEPRLELLDRDTRPLLSIPQSAERLNVDPTTVRALVEKGDIPTIRVGGRRMVEQAAVDAYIEFRRETAGMRR